MFWRSASSGEKQTGVEAKIASGICSLDELLDEDGLLEVHHPGCVLWLTSGRKRRSPADPQRAHLLGHTHAEQYCRLR